MQLVTKQLLLSLTVLLLLVPIPSVRAQDKNVSEDAKKILAQSVRAYQKLDTLTYDAVSDMGLNDTKTADGKRIITAYCGSVTLQHNPADRQLVPGRVLIKLENSLHVYSDGIKISLFPKNKSAVKSLGGLKGRIYYNGLLSADWQSVLPWQTIERLLDSASILRLEKQEKIEGVLCDVVFYSEPTTTFDMENAGWLYFGTEDHLLRRATFNRIHEGKLVDPAGAAGGFQLTMKNLKVDVELPEDTFSVDIPADYKVTEIDKRIKMAPRSSALNIGDAAPDWELKDTEGKSHRLTDYRGKIVVLDFWGTWCQPCIEAMPKIQQLHERFKEQNVVVLGISCNEPEGADPSGLMQKKELTYGSLLKGDEVANRYGVDGYPFIYVIDTNGNVLHRHSSASDEGFAFVEKLLEEKTGNREANKASTNELELKKSIGELKKAVESLRREVNRLKKIANE